MVRLKAIPKQPTTIKTALIELKQAMEAFQVKKQGVIDNEVSLEYPRSGRVELYEKQMSIIKKVINAARLAPSAANLQFLEYLIVRKDNLKKAVFSTTKWAGYIYPKPVPSPKKRPHFYIIILINQKKTKKAD